MARSACEMQVGPGILPTRSLAALSVKYSGPADQAPGGLRRHTAEPPLTALDARELHGGSVGHHLDLRATVFAPLLRPPETLYGRVCGDGCDSSRVPPPSCEPVCAGARAP